MGCHYFVACIIVLEYIITRLHCISVCINITNQIPWQLRMSHEIDLLHVRKQFHSLLLIMAFAHQQQCLYWCNWNRKLSCCHLNALNTSGTKVMAVSFNWHETSDDGLAQERHYCSALTTELHLSSTNSSTWQFRCWRQPSISALWLSYGITLSTLMGDGHSVTANMTKRKPFDELPNAWPCQQDMWMEIVTSSSPLRLMVLLCGKFNFIWKDNIHAIVLPTDMCYNHVHSIYINLCDKQFLFGMVFSHIG